MKLNDMLNMIMNSGNPQQLAMNILNEKIKNTPFAGNLTSMIQSGDAKGVEQFARNLAKERQIDIDTLLSKMQYQR